VGDVEELRSSWVSGMIWNAVKWKFCEHMAPVASFDFGGWRAG
jgi:hypothetical protein